MNNDINVYKNIMKTDKMIKMYPKSYIPQPNDDDYKRGYIIRYFIRQKNKKNSIITEINEKDFEIYSSPIESINYAFYIKVSLRWFISGTLEEIQRKNSNSIAYAEKKMYGLRYKLNNLLQFWKK